MFFIVPALASEPASTVPAPSVALRGERQTTAVGHVEAYYRRRAAAACDRCRLKKARCSGGSAPCNKCKRDRVICVISKDKNIDTQPKPPEYVRMVESQRDLLLNAVHELRQKSNACEQTGVNWDAATDINRVLQQLGVHDDHSEVVRETILDELASPQLKVKDTSSKAPALLSNATHSLSTPRFNHNQRTNHQSATSDPFDFEVWCQSDQNFDNGALFAGDTQPHDSPSYHEHMLTFDSSTSGLPAFNFQDPVDLHKPDIQDFQHPQTRQDGSTQQAHTSDFW